MQTTLSRKLFDKIKSGTKKMPLFMCLMTIADRQFNRLSFRLFRPYLIGFVVWTMLALLTAVRNHLTYLRQGYDVPIPTTLASSFVDFYLWAIASTVIFRWCAKYPLEKPPVWRKFTFYLAFGVVSTLLVALVSVPVFLLLTGGDFAEMRNLSQSIVFSPWNLYQGFFMFWATVAAGHAISYSRRAHQSEIRLRNLAVQLAEAKLSALKMQLQPHFLFNTLNSIHALLHRDADKAEQMIAYLGDFLRMTLTASVGNETTLETELRFLETYLKIERIRFQDKLEVRFDIAPETLRLSVPTLILQPIVENAVRHGFADKSENWLLKIASKVEGKRLVLRVTDNGGGFAPQSNGRGWGLGLQNTRLRLRETFGADFSLTTKNTGVSGGASVEIVIPEVVFRDKK